MLSAAKICEMIDRLRNGDREGFNLLYATYASPLYGIIYRIVRDRAIAENLLEATLVSICNNIHEYDTANSFYTWAIQRAQSMGHWHIKNISRPECKGAMEMVFLGGYTYAETAQKMNTNNDAVRAEVRESLRSYR